MPADLTLEHLKREASVEVDTVAPVGVPYPLAAPAEIVTAEEQELWLSITEEGVGRYRNEDIPLIVAYVRAIILASKFYELLSAGDMEYMQPWKQTEASVRMYTALLGANPASRFSAAAKQKTAQRINAKLPAKNIPDALAQAAVPRSVG